MMQRPLFALSIVVLITGCAGRNQESETPGLDTPAEDSSGEVSDPEPTEEEKAKAARVRHSVTVTHREVESSARVRKHVVPKRPPRAAGTLAVVRHTGANSGGSKGSGLRVQSVSPNVAAPGTMVEFIGTGFGRDRSKIKIDSQGVGWTVASVEPNRVIAQVPRGLRPGAPKLRVGSSEVQSRASFSPLDTRSVWGKSNPGMQGLTGEVFPVPVDQREMPDFAQLGPAVASIAVADFDLSSASGAGSIPTSVGALDAGLAIRFRGTLNVDVEGEFELCVHSDDAAQLLLEDTMIVDDGRSHSARERCEPVYLEPGEYGIELRYLHAQGPGMALKLSWSQGGGEKTVIPSAALFRP